MAKQDFSALMSKVKETQTNTPIQKVTSVKEKKEEILHFNRKLKKLKLISVEKGVSLEELINKAIDRKYF